MAEYKLCDDVVDRHHFHLAPLVWLWSSGAALWDKPIKNPAGQEFGTMLDAYLWALSSAPDAPIVEPNPGDEEEDLVADGGNGEPSERAESADMEVEQSEY